MTPSRTPGRRSTTPTLSCSFCFVAIFGGSVGPSPLYYGGVPPTQRLSFRYVKKTTPYYASLDFIVGCYGTGSRRDREGKSQAYSLFKAPCALSTGKWTVKFQGSLIYNGFFVSQGSEDQIANQRSSGEHPTNEKPPLPDKESPTDTTSESSTATSTAQTPDRSQERGAGPSNASGETMNRFRQIYSP